MATTKVAVIAIRCYRCSYFVGEADRELEFVGMVKKPRDRQMVEPPRFSFVCARCRWTNIFEAGG